MLCKRSVQEQFGFILCFFLSNTNTNTTTINNNTEQQEEDQQLQNNFHFPSEHWAHRGSVGFTSGSSPPAGEVVEIIILAEMRSTKVVTSSGVVGHVSNNNSVCFRPLKWRWRCPLCYPADPNQTLLIFQCFKTKMWKHAKTSGIYCTFSGQIRNSAVKNTNV